MQRPIGLVLASSIVLVLVAGFSTAGASTRFSHTEEIADDASLVFTFEEGSLKRFASVDYQLDGTATVFSPNFGSLHEGLFANVSLTPDDKGRVAATLTLSIPFTPSPGPCTCGPRRVDYFDLTLTNLTSGRVYRLDPVTRTFP
jgi:hypothetical protein